MENGPPDVVRWTPRSGEHGDCAVVAISLATGFTYEETLSACLSIQPGVLHVGLSGKHIKQVLALLGFTSRLHKKRYDLNEDTGLLWVVDTKDEGHIVYLWAGRVIDPIKSERTALWLEADDYVRVGQWTVEGLITLEEDK